MPKIRLQNSPDNYRIKPIKNFEEIKNSKQQTWIIQNNNKFYKATIKDIRNNYIILLVVDRRHETYRVDSLHYKFVYKIMGA